LSEINKANLTAVLLEDESPKVLEKIDFEMFLDVRARVGWACELKLEKKKFQETSSFRK
jgi:hypothetical protein